MPGELEIVEKIRRRAARAAGRGPTALRLGMGDDCAILQPPAGHEIVVTTDFSLEGRHFRRDWHSAHSAGHRTLARGLSDIAAMGAQPLAAFLSLALPRKDAESPRWLDGFLAGLLELAAYFNTPLAGGDTCESPSSAGVLADITLLGSLPAGTALRRDGARPGDLLYCTGRLGGARQELENLSITPPEYNRKFYGKLRWKQARESKSGYPQLFPAPRLAQGIALRERGLATACIDLSDGLSTDLKHLCDASGVAAEVDRNALPVARRLRTADDGFTNFCLLHGGEDYELLFTARPETKVPKQIAGLAVTRIGRILRPERGRPQMTSGTPDSGFDELTPRGWEHFGPDEL